MYAQGECSDVSTGYDPVNGVIYPIGAVDGYWRVTSDKREDGSEIGDIPRCADVIAASEKPLWHPAQGNSQWISSRPTSANDESHTTTFERQFCIGVLAAPGKVQLNLSVLVDNAAIVYIDGTPVATIPDYGATFPYSINTPWPVPTSKTYTISVVVENTDGKAAGLNISGTITDYAGDGIITTVGTCCSGPCHGSNCGTEYLALPTNSRWTIMSDPSGGSVPRCASEIPSPPYQNWGPAIPGSTWIGMNSGGTSSATGDYSFHRYFEVSKNTKLQLRISVMADDAVTVFLDGLPILYAPNWAGSVPTIVEKTIELNTGCHYLILGVEDIGGIAVGVDAMVELSGEGLITDECSTCGQCPYCETEQLELATNSGWTLIKDPSGGLVPRCASEIPSPAYDKWGTAIPGSSWIGLNPDGTSTVKGHYIFQKCFEVSERASVNLNISVMADDAISVSLDSTKIYSSPKWAGSPPVNINATVLLEPGCHCLMFDVHDTQGTATGLDAVVTLTGEGLVTDECSTCGSCSEPPALLKSLSPAPDLTSAGASALTVSPNPSTGTITVSYMMERPAETRLELYNAVGELVTTLDAGEQGAGEYRRSYTPAGLPAGFYLLRLTVDGRAITTSFRMQ